MSVVIPVVEAEPVITTAVFAVQVAEDVSPVTIREEVTQRIWEWAVNRIAYDDDDRDDVTPLKLGCLCFMISAQVAGLIWLLSIANPFTG